MTNYVIQQDADKWLLLQDNILIGTYTRKSSATRRLNTLLAQADNQALMPELALSDASESCAAWTAGSHEVATDGKAVQLPPTSNTGGQNSTGGECVSVLSSHYVMVKGKLTEIPLRMGKGTAAHIDTLTFVVPNRAPFFTDAQYQALPTVEDEESIMLAHIETLMESIMGYGLAGLGNGRHGYKHSARLGIKGDEQINYGFVAWGGERQKDSVCFHFYGMGLTAAVDGWEHRLYQWIKTYAPYTKITRCDLAHDFLQGEYTPIQAFQDWEAGLYTSAHTRPDAETVGRGWLGDATKGKTLYIGSRKNGSRLLRVYEKGIEQGDPNSAWVRFELQLRNRDIVIEPDILLQAGQYLTGAYPICQTLFAHYDEDIKKHERIEKIKQISVEHVIHHASIQCSPAIVMLQDLLGFDDSETINILKRIHAKPSKRLNPAAFDSQNPYVQYLIEHRMRPIDVELHNYVAGQYLSDCSTTTASSAEVKPFATLFQLNQYLECVFGKRPYHPDTHGCDYETYLMRRFGTLETFNHLERISHENPTSQSQIQ